MFSTYGIVEDVSILRNKDGVSKGQLGLLWNLISPSISPLMHWCVCLCTFLLQVYMYNVPQPWLWCLKLMNACKIISSACSMQYSIWLLSLYVCVRISGAAFVRMNTKSEALQAITALHHSQTMPVSWFNSQRERYMIIIKQEGLRPSRLGTRLQCLKKCFVVGYQVL